MRLCIDGIVYGNNAHGGVARYWTGLLKALSDLRVLDQIDLVIPRKAVRPVCGARIQRIGMPGAYWAAARAGVFHSTYYTRWPRIKCPSVITVYDFVDAAHPLCMSNGPDFVDRQRAVIERADAVIAISKTTALEIQQYTETDGNKIYCAYPGVASPFTDTPPSQQDRFSFRARLTGGAPYFLHVGKRGMYKNFRTLFRAFCRVASQIDHHLVLVGDRNRLLADEWDCILTAGLESRVHYRPYVDDPWLRLAYAASDALVHASIQEGFGIPVIEALACGTACILSDIPVYREIASGLAQFVNPISEDAWAEAFLDPPQIDSGARDQVLNKYQWDKAADTHIRAYRDITGQR